MSYMYMSHSTRLAHKVWHDFVSSILIKSITAFDSYFMKEARLGVQQHDKVCIEIRMCWSWPRCDRKCACFTQHRHSVYMLCQHFTNFNILTHAQWVHGLLSNRCVYVSIYLCIYLTVMESRPLSPRPRPRPRPDHPRPRPRPRPGLPRPRPSFQDRDLKDPRSRPRPETSSLTKAQ